MPTVSGNVGAVFNGGTITNGLTIQPPTPGSSTTLAAFNLGGSGAILEVGDEVNDRLTILHGGNTTFVTGSGGIGVDRDGDSAQAALISGASLLYLQRASGAPALDLEDGAACTFYQGVATHVITSGALPTVSPSSTTAFQCSTARDVYLVVPFTLTTAAGTCKVELSPDNMTFSTLVTLTPAVNASVSAASLHVPAAWWVKLTVTNATLGTGTYY